MASSQRLRYWLTPRRAVPAVLGVLLLATAGYATLAKGRAPDFPTTEVTRGEFVDIIELRGEIRPIRSTVVTAPMQAGDLQIVKLAKEGTTVAPGDVVVEFDASTLQRTRQEKLSELRQAQAEIDQAQAETRIAEEQTRTALMKARYDVDRAALEVIDRDFVARLDLERSKLALEDAQQRLREAEARAESDRAANAANIAARERRRAKVQQDLDRAERALQTLQLRSPIPGVVSILPNFRNSGMMSSAQEFREGDRAWPGAGILELPDLTSVLLTARLEEADRGRLAVGQTAAARLDGVPDHEYHAKVSDISLLTRVDFSSGWPPPKDFDLKLSIDDADARLRPGMSATVRISVGRLTDVLILPSEAVVLVNGRPTVFVLDGSRFVPRPVTVAKRGREQVAIGDGVGAGERVALRRPPPNVVADR